MQRAIATAGPGVQVVLREPYSLGRLWAERAESRFDAPLQVCHRGPGSRYLSRDVFVDTGPAAG